MNFRTRKSLGIMIAPWFAAIVPAFLAAYDCSNPAQYAPMDIGRVYCPDFFSVVLFEIVTAYIIVAVMMLLSWLVEKDRKFFGFGLLTWWACFLTIMPGVLIVLYRERFPNADEMAGWTALFFAPALCVATGYWLIAEAREPKK